MNDHPIRKNLLNPPRPATWGVRLGYWYGTGLSSVQVAHILNQSITSPSEATGDGAVRTMLQRSCIPPRDRKKVPVILHLEEWERDILQRHADDRKVDIQTLIYRMVASGLVLDDLYDAVTDGRYS